MPRTATEGSPGSSGSRRRSPRQWSNGDSPSYELCSRQTEWGQCQQRAHLESLCRFHLRFLNGETPPDRYYHEKVVKLLVMPTLGWMTASEEKALLKPRYRGDGRRLDDWTFGLMDADHLDGDWRRE